MMAYPAGIVCRGKTVNAEDCMTIKHQRRKPKWNWTGRGEVGGLCHDMFICVHKCRKKVLYCLAVAGIGGLAVNRQTAEHQHIYFIYLCAKSISGAYIWTKFVKNPRSRPR